MPGLNRTGPEGQGPGTGRRMGTCRPQKDKEESSSLSSSSYNEKNGTANFWSEDMGRRCGFGRGRGYRGGRGFERGRGRGPASK